MTHEKATREHLVARVADILEEISRSGPHTVSQEWFTLDLSMPHVRAVFLLFRADSPLRMSDLAATLGVSLSRATGLVDRLVEKSLVERWTDPDDRRSVLCTLTQKGGDLVRRLLAERRSRWEERLASLSEDELKKVCEAMELVRKAAKKAASQHSSTEQRRAAVS